MDAEIWRASKRGFPFNIPLWLIVLVCFGVPFALSFLAFDQSNTYLWKLYLSTLGLSAVAYFVADKAID
jgi:hypothetical protein